MNARYQTIKITSYVNALTNTLLAIFKIFVGYFGQSQALVADGIHSFSDLISDALVLVAGKFGNKHPDQDHPYGHQRIETLASIVIALILLLVGVGIIQHAWHHLHTHHTLSIATTPVLIIALVSIGANEWLYRYTLRQGKKVNSHLLINNALHNRSDVLVSIIVLLGILMNEMGWQYGDTIGALVIALLIIQMAIKMLFESINELIDAAAPPETVKKIATIVRKIAGVKAIHLLRTRLHSGNLMLDMHIMVDPNISVSEGHHISDQVQLALQHSELPIVDITVHIDPENDENEMLSLNLPSRPQVEQWLKHCWHTLPGFSEMTHIQLHYLEGKLWVDAFFTSTAHALITEAVLAEYREKIAGLSCVFLRNCYFVKDAHDH